MSKRFIAPVAALLFAAFVFGCGSKSSVVTAPKNPGNPAALVNTTWSDPGTNAVYKFTSATDVEITYPQAQAPVKGSYTINKGLVEITAGFQTIDATWNGKDLVLKGKSLVKQ